MAAAAVPVAPVLPNQSSPQSLAETQRQVRQAAEKAFGDAQVPDRSGVVDTLVKLKLTPYFRSAKTQNTNDAVKSQLQSLYTGNNDDVYRSKTEKGPQFEATPQQVTSAGSAGNPNCDRRMPAPPVAQNNILPFQQQRVGPGLGIGTDVPAADGFHPMLRIVPENVNEYRTNSLGTRIVPGKAPTPARTVTPNVANTKPPTTWDMIRRPPEPTKAAVNARTQRSHVVLRCVSKPAEEYYGGVNHAAGPNVASDSKNTNLRDDRNDRFPATNVTGARAGIGAHAVVDARTQRTFNDRKAHEGVVANLRGPAGVRAREMHDVAPTLRDLAGSGYTGAAMHHVPTGAVKGNDGPRLTLRQLHSEKTEFGVVGTTMRAPTIQCTYKQLNKPAKRPLVEGYTHMPQRSEAFRRANMAQDDPMAACPGKMVALREKNNRNRIVSHQASGIMYRNYGPPGASANGHNWLPSHNPRQDFSIASVQLQSNPLAVKR